MWVGSREHARTVLLVAAAPALVGGLVCLLFLLAQRRPADTRPAAGPRAVTVRRGGDLQRALEEARPGDTILLEAGATFTGPFTLPYKPGTNTDADWITVRTSTPDDKLPGPDERITPAHAPLLPKLVAPGNVTKALQTAPRAHHYRFVGVEFAPSDAAADVRNIIWLGNADEKSVDELPHHLVLDRCYIHGFPDSQQRRAVALNSASTDIVNSYISDIHLRGDEGQGIMGWNGPGPYRIVNNYVEAAGINLMFGGEAPSIRGLVPSNIELRRNHFRKPLSWKGRWTVKNLFELKNAQRVRVEGNVFENVWADAQVGYAIVLTPRGEAGRAPWSVVRDVTFQNNVVRNFKNGITLLGSDYQSPTERTERVTFRNNLFDGGAEGGGWFLLATHAPRDAVFEHNTVIHDGHVIYTDGNETATGFVYRDNIHTRQFIAGNETSGQGWHALGDRFPGYVFRGNVLVRVGEWIVDPALHYPPGNSYVNSVADIGFANPSAGDYRLSPSSRFRHKATDGRDPGCDFAALEAATAGVRQ